jgi:SPP1 gp7 family putative phage head morphogenesis protein
MRLDVERFLEDLTGRYAKPYTEAVGELRVAKATGNRDRYGRARADLEATITETMGVAEVLGASMVLQKAASVHNSADGAFQRWRPWPDNPGTIDDAIERDLLVFANFQTQTILPRVTLAEAVEDMIDRTPVTIRRAAERTAQRIAQLYSEGRVTAFVASAENAVTVRVQSLIKEAMIEGISETEAGRMIVRNVDMIRQKTGAWTEGYSRMAFRTNVNTAVTAGRFRQAQDPDVKAVIPCFRHDAVGDADTRPNHQAGDGRILKVDNPAWNRLASPLGYNCRCQTSLVSVAELKRLGRISPSGAIREDRVPTAWFPDPDFRHGGRPDLMMVEVAR